MQNLTCYIDMINGHAFMYPKLKPTFWLNPWKLVSTNINGTIVHACIYVEHLAYGVLANEYHFLSTLNNFIIIQIVNNNLDLYKEIQEKIIPVSGTCTEFKHRILANDNSVGLSKSRKTLSCEYFWERIRNPISYKRHCKKTCHFKI